MAVTDVEQVCRHYGASVLRRCRAMIRDPDEAKDVAQEVFVTILNKGAQLREADRVGVWVYRLATNQCLNHIRAHQRRTARETSQAVIGWQDRPSDNPLARASLKNLVVLLTGRLDDLGQQIFVYRYLDGMTQAEIAELTQRSRRTVGKRLTAIEKTIKQIERETQ